ncbi:alpha/beta hydrolase fold protein [Thalassoporum mexicanum PCC 7367]|uniref:YheT family hydrolase n=1 Tax=Thalassoporum mexicanum TaxID=3457544 RepID=UPI00029FD862|nr:alpha/beta fold hydrolase [Pseudanabaena sp. PCC 7367]AFY70388.1 alpha/beta hydrolase fold protein [Pseudanabaena sp. PCC 7367]
MYNVDYEPPQLLKNGTAMTVYTAFRASKDWQKYTAEPEPTYQEHVFKGAGDVPLFGIMARAGQERSRGTIIGTYGITGDVQDQWFLRILGRKAHAHNYNVVLFDWRAHGKTAELSPTLTSDGIHEGKDFVCIAAQAKELGYEPPFWFAGFSLGGQLALWAVHAANTIEAWRSECSFNIELSSNEIGGGAVICPSVDSNRSLRYLMSSTVGKRIDRAIARQLKKLVKRIHEAHPGTIDPEAIKRANTIWGFDHEFVIDRLGFPTVEAYYDASSALPILPQLAKPTLVIYAADDPMFDPTIVPDLDHACSHNPKIELMLSEYGGHVGFISNKACQRQWQDPDRWWAWNRTMNWFNQYSPA